MRVLIFDDHPIVIAGCRALLADEAEMLVAGAADAESGAAFFAAEPPDVCVIDIDLPSISGLELLQMIVWHREKPERRCRFFPGYREFRPLKRKRLKRKR